MSGEPPCTGCKGTGIVWTVGCTCGGDGYYPHERYCGAEPCPFGCPVTAERTVARVQQEEGK